MHILICSQGNDPHIDTVVQILKKNGASPILFERYKKNNFITFKFIKNENLFFIKTGNKKYSLDHETFPSVWWRIKPLISSEISGGTTNIPDQFRMHEWKNAIFSFNKLLNRSRWINPMIHNQEMSSKIYQLKLAAESKLFIPETVITNDNENILEILRKNKIIYKTLSSFITEKKAIYTNEVSIDDIKESRDSIFKAPGIFQKLIEKDHELRVTIVGNRIFTMKINSQSKKSTSLDWRHEQTSAMFSEGFLSEKTSKNLLSFHKKSKLIFAAYDFAVDKNGKEIFLECNPGGQWFWKKNDFCLEISKAIASELMP